MVSGACFLPMPAGLGPGILGLRWCNTVTGQTQVGPSLPWGLFQLGGCWRIAMGRMRKGTLAQDHPVE
jgi:hypothetical protein